MHFKNMSSLVKDWLWTFWICGTAQEAAEKSICGGATATTLETLCGGNTIEQQQQQQQQPLPSTDEEDEDDDDDDEDCWEQSVARLLQDSSTEQQHRLMEHVRQRETWDCGIACLQMIFSFVGVVCTRDDLVKEIQTESIWTVDLVLLLEKYLVDGAAGSYLFSSTTLSVSKEFQEFQYYKKNFSCDRQRVGDIFLEIQSRRLPVPVIKRNHLELEQVVSLVERDCCIAMVLVDNSVLTESDATITCYVGHYIVVTGVSRQENDYSFLIQNPGNESCTCLSAALFERAWRAAGTDMDIIFVSRKGVT
jgi:hypothetical protein